MGRISSVLDEAVDYGFEGGARYMTNVSDNPNRFEERDIGWKYPKHEYEASYGNIKDDSRDFLIAFFHMCRGKAHSFLFKDWNDFEILDQEITVLPGTTNPIQLYKTYSPFGPPWVTVRPIQAFKSCDIIDDTDTIVPGTLNKETGLFTPDSAWGTGVYKIKQAEFYVWVRFDDDYNSMTINSWQANTTRVRLIEDPLAFTAENVPDSWDGT